MPSARDRPRPVRAVHGRHPPGAPSPYRPRVRQRVRRRVRPRRGPHPPRRGGRAGSEPGRRGQSRGRPRARTRAGTRAPPRRASPRGRRRQRARRIRGPGRTPPPPPLCGDPGMAPGERALRAGRGAGDGHLLRPRRGGGGGPRHRRRGRHVPRGRGVGLHRGRRLRRVAHRLPRARHLVLRAAPPRRRTDPDRARPAAGAGPRDRPPPPGISDVPRRGGRRAGDPDRSGNPPAPRPGVRPGRAERAHRTHRARLRKPLPPRNEQRPAGARPRSRPRGGAPGGRRRSASARSRWTTRRRRTSRSASIGCG